MRTFLLSISLILLLSGCATSHTANNSIKPSKPSLTKTQSEIWKLMIGRWYGSQPTTDGGTQQWIIEHKPQGTFKVTYRWRYSDGTVRDSIESGQWGVSGPVYFSIFRGYGEGSDFSPVDPRDPYNYDAYKIIQLTNDSFEYEHFDVGDHFMAKRVPADFDFPK